MSARTTYQAEVFNTLLSQGWDPYETLEHDHDIFIHLFDILVVWFVNKILDPAEEGAFNGSTSKPYH
jgi:hypothetical protein